MREGLGVGEKGEKEDPSNRWPGQNWGFQTRGWEGAGHLHLEAVLVLDSFPSAPGQRKELGNGEGCFYSDRRFKHPQPLPHTDRMDKGEGSW